MNENIWIKYLLKKGILKKGLNNLKENDKEEKEFLQMLYRLKKSQKVLSNSSPPVRTSNSTSLTSAKQKGFNMGLEVQKSKISSPKLSPTEITSPNPNIKCNLKIAPTRR